jgi:UDP-N-acetylglucosamine acyltransferase
MQQGPEEQGGPRIHPTAVISPEAELADNVVIGPHVVIEGKVTIGPDCILRPHVFLCGPLTMGRGNVVFSGAILGERPQHLKYNDEPTSLEIGDHNVFREHVTVHRGTAHSLVTRIGSHNFFMAGAHVGHDCSIGNRCIFTNGALVGGHCTIEDNVYMSGNSAIHQFVRVGRLALLSGCSATTKDIPPFIVQQYIDTVVGINVVGMRRAGMTHTQINAVREAFRILFRAGLSLPAAVARLEKELGTVDAVQEMIAFLSKCPKGINPMRSRRLEAA